MTGPVARVVGARRFAGAWPEVLERFTRDGEAEVMTYLAGAYRLESDGNRELRRLRELSGWRELVTLTVTSVAVP